MIAASIALAFALYFSTVVLLHSLAGFVFKQTKHMTMPIIVASVSWAAFYYFTHA